MKILATVLTCAIVSAIGAIGFICSRLYDVSALQPDNALVAWAVHTTSNRSISGRLGAITAPPGLEQPLAAQSGGHIFIRECAVCHGGPGLNATDIARGLNPSPPDLFFATRKPEAAENFRFIKYAVKMTAMPGFRPTQTEEQIWALRPSSAKRRA